MSDQFISGAYTSAFGPNGNTESLGLTESGWSLHTRRHKEPIVADESGRTLRDAILLGEDLELHATGLEYEKIYDGLYAAFGTGEPYANVGLLATSKGTQLILTPVGGITALKPAYIFYCVVCDNDIELMLHNGLKKGPLAFTVYPNPAAGATQGLHYGVTYGT